MYIDFDYYPPYSDTISGIFGTIVNANIQCERGMLIIQENIKCVHGLMSKVDIC